MIRPSRAYGPAILLVVLVASAGCSRAGNSRQSRTQARRSDGVVGRLQDDLRSQVEILSEIAVQARAAELELKQEGKPLPPMVTTHSRTIEDLLFEAVILLQKKREELEGYRRGLMEKIGGPPEGTI